MHQQNTESILIGWGERDVTPDKSVVLCGGSQGISKGVGDPLIVTAIAITAADSGDCMVFVSCDRVHVPGDILARCRKSIKTKVPELDPQKIILNATHSHTAPHIIQRVLPPVPEDVMSPDEYADFFVDRVTDAVAEAWANRQPAGIAYGLSYAVIGHNRRIALADGMRKMYATTNDPLFSHIEGYEDHSVDLLFTWDDKNDLTGIVINIACPSQETESDHYVSADFWHEIREEVRSKFGKNLFILSQCAPAGDQSPHRMICAQYGCGTDSAAPSRMLDLKGITMRREIARRVTSAIEDVLPHVKKDIQRKVVFKHIFKTIDLPRRLVSEEVYVKAKAYYKEYEQKKPVSFDEKRKRLWGMRRYGRLIKRYEEQDSSPLLPMELHVVRLGDIAFATNCFELFLDFGIQIKARSRAIQTFPVQLCAGGPGWWYASGSGGYLPTLRAVKGCLAETEADSLDDGSPSAGRRGYGAGVACIVGPEGGQVIVEETLKDIEKLW